MDSREYRIKSVYDLYVGVRSLLVDLDVCVGTGRMDRRYSCLAYAALDKAKEVLLAAYMNAPDEDDIEDEGIPF